MGLWGGDVGKDGKDVGRRPAVYKQFDPHSKETANAWQAVWSTIFPVLKGPCKGGLDHKAWNYPYVKEEGNVPVRCMPQHISPMQDLD